MDWSKLTDEDLYILDNVLIRLRESYETLIKGTATIGEMANSEMETSLRALAEYGHSMTEFETELRQAYESRQNIRVSVEDVLKKNTVKFKPEVKKKPSMETPYDRRDT